MAAAEQLWTDDPRYYGDGTSFFCCALSDPEDPPPLLRPHTMSDKDDDFRGAVTTPAPDTEPRVSTQPPGEADAEATRQYESMLASLGNPPATLADSYLDQAIRVVAKAGDAMALDRVERRQQHDAVLEAIVRADKNASRNYEMLRDEIRHLKESDRQQDAKITDLRLELAALKDQVVRQGQDLAQAMKRIDELEKRIADDDAPEDSATAG